MKKGKSGIIKRIFILLIYLLIFSLVACMQEKPQEPFDPKTDPNYNAFTGYLHYGDFTSSKIEPSSISQNTIQISGIQNYLKVDGMSGIKGFKPFGKSDANAFVTTEKNKHQVWMIIDLHGFGERKPVKLGGIPGVAGHADGFYSWFNTPVDIERKLLDANTELIFVTDSENRKVRMITVIKNSDNSLMSYTATYSSLTHRPIGITRDSSDNLYVTTKEGAVLKIASDTNHTVTELTTGQGSYLYGISVNEANDTLYYANGLKVYSLPVTGGTPTLIKDNMFSSDTQFKDIEYYKNGSDEWLFIADGSTNCIYKMRTNGNDFAVFAGAQNTHGDSLGLLADARFQKPYGISMVKNVSVLVGDAMYISDFETNKVKSIANMDTNPQGLGEIPLTSLNPNTDIKKYLCDPLGMSLSPGGDHLYVVSSNDEKIKQVAIKTSGKDVQEITLGGFPFGIWDTKVVQQRTLNGYLRDRYLISVEVNKLSFEGRISVYDLVLGGATPYQPICTIPNFGPYGAAIALNQSATKVWVTSREGNGGIVYHIGFNYNPDTGQFTYTTPTKFLQKKDYFPLGITYVKIPETNTSYLFVTAVTYSGSNCSYDPIFCADGAVVSRFTLNQGSGGTRVSGSDIDPAVDAIDWEYWKMPAGENLMTLYPRFITSAGKYVYFVENRQGRVYVLDATKPAGQTPSIAQAKFIYENKTSIEDFIPFGIAVDGTYGKIYLSSEAHDLVISN